MSKAATAKIALSMRGVHKRFGGIVALDGVDLEVLTGEVHALIGENGAGKSTLMKILSGVHRPDSGSIELFGERFDPLDPLDALSSGIAMIYQEMHLAPHLSAEENIVLGREPVHGGGIARGRMRESAQRALQQLDHGDLDPALKVAELSVGLRQVVEVARALCSEARVVVMDEPTSSLSGKDVERLFQVVSRLKEQGVAVIYISHFLDEVRRVADHYTVLRDGRSVATGEVARTSSETIIEQMIGRRLTDLYPSVPHAPGEVILELRGVSGHSSPSAASLDLRRGEILGLAGLVGAGRTELLRVLFGLDPVRRGEVRVGGVADFGLPPQKRLGQGVGMLSENRKEEGLLLNRPICENLTLSLLHPYVRLGFLDLKHLRRSARTWMQRLKVKAADERQITCDLSGGNQQKVALARLLHHDVDVLLLDEPTRGIDVGSKAEIYRWIGELAAQGKAILMVSSYLPELLGVCDRVAVMHKGRLGEPRRVEEWTEAQIFKEAMAGVLSRGEERGVS